MNFLKVVILMSKTLENKSTWMTGFCMIVFALTIFLGGCSTAPKTISEGGFEKPDDHEYLAIVLSDLKSNKETAAYVTGVTTGMGSEKVIPDLPDAIADPIRSNPEGLGWVTGVVDTLKEEYEDYDITDFDSLIVAMPSHSTQTKTYLKFYERKQDVIETEAYLVNLENEELVGSNRYFTRYSDAAGEEAGLASITKAGKSAISDLINK